MVSINPFEVMTYVSVNTGTFNWSKQIATYMHLITSLLNYFAVLKIDTSYLIWSLAVILFTFGGYAKVHTCKHDYKNLVPMKAWIELIYWFSGCIIVWRGSGWNLVFMTTFFKNCHYVNPSPMFPIHLLTSGSIVMNSQLSLLIFVRNHDLWIYWVPPILTFSMTTLFILEQ